MKPPAKQYKTSNWSEYNQALKSRGSLTFWLDPKMQWYSEGTTGKRGASPLFSDKAIQCCLMLKGLFGVALRQVTGLIESLFLLMNIDWIVPDYSTLSRRQGKLQVEIPYQGNASGNLHLLVDSTGIKMLGEGEWKAQKHGREYKRQWRKLHIGIDAETLEVRAVVVTTSSIGDAPILPDLLAQIPANEALLSVTADGAYDTRGCHEAIASRGADAIIPTRKNAKKWKENSLGAKARNAIFYATQRLGRSVWKKWSHYHRRSLVETKMRCIKRLGENMMSRCFARQVAELHIRMAILNRFTMLGRPLTAATV
jgi:Transposase DDE domain